MNGTDLEKELVKWSNRQGYVLGERRWGTDIEAEIDFEFEHLSKGSEAVFLPGSTVGLRKMMDWAEGDKNLAKKSLIELNNFISPLTVIVEECKTIKKYRDEIDKIVLPTLKFLEEDN